jgi:predicted PurR-regulated permease PerM
LSSLRSESEKRYALAINDPRPVESVDTIWTAASQLATIGIFLILLGAVLYFGRPLLLPILAAMVIGATLAPLVKRLSRKGISPWLTSIVLTLLILVAIGVGITLLAAPITEWAGRAPEIGASIKQKLYVFDRPLAAWRELQAVVMPKQGNTVAVEESQIAMVTPVVAFVTPAIAQIVLFFTTLLFALAVQVDLRRYVVSLFSDRDAKLRFLRIANDIEHNLASYLTVVSVINMGLGVIVGLGAWAFGFPNPFIFGVLAAVLNYIPYVGPAIMAVALFGVGLVTFPTLGYALLPPACLVALTTIEGHVVTPTILGKRMTLNPFAVVLALSFWTWMWGPMGTFLAVPLSIIGMVITQHLFPSDDPKLPG